MMTNAFVNSKITKIVFFVTILDHPLDFEPRGPCAPCTGGGAKHPSVEQLEPPNSVEKIKNATFSENVRKCFRCSKITREHSWMLPDDSRVYFGVSGGFSYSTIFRLKNREPELQSKND